MKIRKGEISQKFKKMPKTLKIQNFEKTKANILKSVNILRKQEQKF